MTLHVPAFTATELRIRDARLERHRRMIEAAARIQTPPPSPTPPPPTPPRSTGRTALDFLDLNTYPWMLSPKSTKHSLQEQLQTRDPRLPEIIAAVCQFYVVGKKELVSERRNGALPYYRQVCYWLGKRLTKLSLPQIGRNMGGRDHTTVLHGVARINHYLATDQRTVEELRVLVIQLRGGRDEEEVRAEDGTCESSRNKACRQFTKTGKLSYRPESIRRRVEEGVVPRPPEED